MSKSISKKEGMSLFWTILVMAFVFSFRNWGVETFDAVYGLKSLLLTAVFVAIAMLSKTYVQKYLAHKLGFQAEFKPWTFGIILSLILIMITNGFFIFLAIGTFTYSIIEHIRVGHKHRFSHRTLAWIAAFGILTNIMLAAIFKLLIQTDIFPEQILLKAMAINIWIAIFCILPIPYININMKNILQPWWHKIDTSEGLQILYHSRWMYVGMLAFIFTCSAAILFLPTFTGFLISAFFSALVWWIYYVTKEQYL